MLVAGSAVVLFMLVVLVRAVNSGSSAVTPTSRAAQATTEAAPAAAHGTPQSTAARSRNLPPLPGRMPGHRPERSDDGPAPLAVDDHPPPASRANTTHLEYGGTQLRAQAKAVEPLVHECIAAETAAGVMPTGKAMLTYVVAKRGDKYLVEDTAIDDENTTLHGDKLLECLRETARGMKFVGLPREAEALVVSRSVTVEHGKITEYKHVGFSYLR
jgi:hypothetical protein